MSDEPDETFTRQAAVTDRLVTEALALVGVQHPANAPSDEFISATLSGAVMAIVRYHAEAGRHLGYDVTARMIIRALTPCLHRSAEAVAPKIASRQSPRLS